MPTNHLPASRGRAAGQARSPLDEARDGPPAGAALSCVDVGRLFRTERLRLWRSVRRRVADPEEAADLVQDAFARLVHAQPPATLRTPAAYLQRIVRNLLHDRAKSARRRVVYCDLAAVECELPSAPADQGWSIEASDLMHQYKVALAQLSPRTREVFLLHRVDDLRYRDIAERLGITVATVEYHMTRALLHLDTALAP